MNRYLSKLFPSDVQALSLFRILLGLIILGDLFLTILPCVPDIYLEDGFFPRSVYMEIGRRAGNISLLSLTGYPWLIGLFFAAYACALISFIIGYRTTLSKWIVFICQCSVLFRGMPTMAGGDKLIHLFLLWSLFVPLHRYWSVDAALSRAPRDAPVPGVLMAGIKLQICWLYFFGATFKLFNPPWRDGTAITRVLHDPIWSTSWGHVVATYFPFLLMPLTYGVIVFQLFFIVLIFAPLLQPYMRTFAILGAAAMHAGFLLLLNVGIFPYICLAYLVLLVPDTWWNRLFAKRRARCEKIVISFEDGCRFCEKMALLFREFCLSPFSRVQPASNDPDIEFLLRQNKSWIVHDTLTHTVYMKWEAVAFLLRQSFVFWPFGVVTDLPYIKKLFACAYDWIGNHRTVFAAWTSRALPFRNDVYAPGFWTKTTCSTLIVLTIVGNIMVVSSLENITRSSTAFWDVLTLLQTYQQWNLFVPPDSNFYSYTLEGTTRSRKTVDLRPLFEKGRFDSSDGTHWTFSTCRWLSFFWRLSGPSYRPVLQRTLQTMAERYNARIMDFNDQVGSVRFVFKREPLDAFNAGIQSPIIAEETWVVPVPWQVTPRLTIP